MLKAIFNGFKGKIRGKLDILGLGTTHKVWEHVETCGNLGTSGVKLYNAY